MLLRSAPLARTLGSPAIPELLGEPRGARGPGARALGCAGTAWATIVPAMARKWWTLMSVCVAIFMLLLDITIVNVALPAIQKSLKTSFSDLQWVIDAYAPDRSRPASSPPARSPTCSGANGSSPPGS